MQDSNYAKVANFFKHNSCFVISQGWTVNVFLVPLYTEGYQAENIQSSSLKPSSFCLRQNPTVDLTLNGVKEHMQRREKEHDRWTIECIAGLWKTVMEEATRGDPKIHTPSMVLVQPIERVRFQGRGQETSRPYVVSVSMHVFVCVHAPFSEHIYMFGAKLTDQSQVALRSHLLSLVIWACRPWPHLFLTAADRSSITRQKHPDTHTHNNGCTKLYLTLCKY